MSRPVPASDSDTESNSELTPSDGDRLPRALRLFLEFPLNGQERPQRNEIQQTQNYSNFVTAQRDCGTYHAGTPDTGRGGRALYGCALLEDRAPSHKADARYQTLQQPRLSGHVTLRPGIHEQKV